MRRRRKRWRSRESEGEMDDEEDDDEGHGDEWDDEREGSAPYADLIRRGEQYEGKLPAYTQRTFQN